MESQLKQLITEAQKSQDTIAKDVLRLVLGQIQSDSSIKTLSEDQKFSIVRKIIKSNEITLAAMAETEKQNWNQDWQDSANKLLKEIKILNSLLPQTWSKEQIVIALENQVEAIQGAKSDGQAIGVAIKHLKSLEAIINAETVKSIVANLRSLNASD